MKFNTKEYVKHKHILSFVIIVLLLSAYWVTSEKKASLKPFWFDEIQEMNQTIRDSVKDLLLKGAKPQASPNPLYYIISKSIYCNFYINNSEKDAPLDILIKQRTVSRFSILFLLLILALVCFVIFKVHPVWVVFIFAILLGQVKCDLDMGQILWASAETRPYAFWLFLSGLHLFFVLYAFELKNNNGKIPAFDYLILSIISLSLMLTAAPGFFQVFVTLFFLVPFHSYKKYIQSKYLPATFLLIIGMGFSIYYAINPFRDVPALHRWSAWGTVANFILGYKNPAGFLIMCLGWVRVVSCIERPLSRVIIGYCSTLAIVIILIHIKGYYFIPRVIIFGHLLSFVLIISGILEFESRITPIIKGSRLINFRYYRHGIIIILTLFSILFSKPFKDMIEYGIFLKEIKISDETKAATKESIKQIDFKNRCNA